ncbi:MAG: hypothetical protein KGL36_06430 [Gammaproteobacteria bacterium]|nr:hypothetical protein [Gammaproteobacteria bacterium]
MQPRDREVRCLRRDADRPRAAGGGRVPQLAVAVDDPRRLRAAVAAAQARRESFDTAPATHWYFGSEFCEHLFPSRTALQRAVAAADRDGLTLVLMTPVANDALVERIEASASALPRSAEIVVNDWGVAHRLRTADPDRTLVAGRQLAKTIKDPRLPSPAWLAPFSGGYANGAFHRLLQRLRIERLELDVPPFATASAFDVDGFAVSVWAPYGYAAKGRICKIGSSSRARATKFSPGGRCRRECRRVSEIDADPPASGATAVAQIGNTLLYRHGDTETAAVRAGVDAGRIDRLVVTED